MLIIALPQTTHLLVAFYTQWLLFSPPQVMLALEHCIDRYHCSLFLVCFVRPNLFSAGVRACVCVCLRGSERNSLFSFAITSIIVVPRVEMKHTAVTSAYSRNGLEGEDRCWKSAFWQLSARSDAILFKSKRQKVLNGVLQLTLQHNGYLWTCSLELKGKAGLHILLACVILMDILVKSYEVFNMPHNSH